MYKGLSGLPSVHALSMHGSSVVRQVLIVASNRPIVHNTTTTTTTTTNNNNNNVGFHSLSF